MKLILIVSLSLFVSLLPTVGQNADISQESKLISILQSSHSQIEKAAACAELKRIATRQSIPVLQTLLTNEEFSHSARYVLEPMPWPEAGQALLAALPELSGSNKVGIIDSLAMRKETTAIVPLTRLLPDPDTDVAVAAAEALGKIGGKDSATKLEAAIPNSTGASHQAQVDALLEIANFSLTHGNAGDARKIFQRLYDHEKSESDRVAAFRGLILSSGKRGISLMSSAIAGTDNARQGAALQMATHIQEPGVTGALAALLPRVEPPVQIALLQALDQRGDPSAAAGIVPFANHSTPDVELAAITALGDLGDGSVAILLAEKAADAPPAQQAAAQEALVNLRRGPVTADMLKSIGNAPPKVQLELLRALGNRGDQSAVPKLVELAQTDNDPLRSASCQAIALLAGAHQIPELVHLVTIANGNDARSEAADALGAVCQRIQAQGGHVEALELASAVRSAPLEARLSLLPICGGLNDPACRDALRAAAADSNSQVREAAISAMCDTHDPELLPDLAKLASNADDKKLQLLAIRGCVRLTTQEESVKIPAATTLGVFKQILDAPLNAPEKRLILSGLGAVANKQALETALPMLDQPDIRAEAARAIIQISSAIYFADAEPARTALEKVVALNENSQTQKDARALLRKIDDLSTYITTWQVAGPYQEEGKNFKALFDIAFPPEAANGETIQWQRIPAGTDSAQPWKLDLLRQYPGEQRVAYARTFIYSPVDQKARLELGSDDGNKVWINGQLVHANNVSRGLRRDSDQIDISLLSGWNPLLLKVTQNTLGWEFCARIVSPAGKPLPNLRASATPE